VNAMRLFHSSATKVLTAMLAAWCTACDDGGGSGADAPAAPDTASAITATELADLRYMREEEKLARDVYRAMLRSHATPVFANIAASEQTHMDALGGLLRQYGVEEATPAEGRFTISELGGLYQTLVARGQTSAAEALRVGAEIERLDIADLDEAIARTDRGDIIAVYQRLRQGSENHLRAFTGGGGGRGN
jgi:hypothetical protein